jgi:hypothetical protein
MTRMQQKQAAVLCPLTLRNLSRLYDSSSVMYMSACLLLAFGSPAVAPGTTDDSLDSAVD